MDNIILFGLFVKSRVRWILWIILLHVILIGLAYLDYNIDVASVLFIVWVNLGLTALFIIFSFFKEAKFINHLRNNKEIEELVHKNLASTPFQQEVVNYFQTKIANQKALVTQQTKQIKDYEQSLTTFIHDIKTPVTTLDLIINKVDDPTQKFALMREWTRINEMLDMQLYLTRLDSRQKDIFFEYAALKPLIIDEIQLTRYISQTRGIDFELTVDSEIKVYTDTKWCKMLIRQVLSNAIKYSEQSTISIIATVEANQIQLQIADRGIGISQRDIKRVFDRGFTSTQRQNATNATGLGLYLVNQIKDTLNLHVEIDSVVDQGTTVTIIFPEQNNVIKRMSEQKI